MTRYKLVLEYDGTNYSGWQKQKNAKTIQGTLIETITRVIEAEGGRFIDLQGAGRTDAGVHAYGQVAHLDADTGLKPAALLAAINEALPSSIGLLSIEIADDRFHARHWASSRQYLYRISKRRNVFEKRHVFWCKDRLDLAAMREAAASLTGMHDFSSFSSKPAKEKSTRVLLEGIEIGEQDDLILIRVRASHFLWNMVRILVGALLEVGKGQLEAAQLRAALDAYTPDLASLRAPSSGLFLEQVEYQHESRQQQAARPSRLGKLSAGTFD